MKKVIFISTVILTMTSVFTFAQSAPRISGPITAALPVVKVGHTEATLVGLVNPNGLTTSVWFEVDGEVRGSYDGLTGHDAVPVTCRPRDLKPGQFHHFRVHSINSAGYKMSEEQLFFIPSVLDLSEVPVIDENHIDPDMALYAISAKCGDPKIMSVGASLAFFTSGVDSVAIYVNYVGSAGSGSGDQIGIQFGKATSSLLDSVETQFTTTASGQMVFDFKNLESTVQAGVQYNYRLFAFDAGPPPTGGITFYPGPSATYPITTAPAPAVSSMGSSTVSCITKVISYGPVYSNDQQTWIDGIVDTVPGMNSNYGLMYGAIPQFQVGLINQMACTLNVSPYIVWDPNNVSAKYYVKLRIRNSSSAMPVDSTTANTPCMLPAGVNNLENGESFTIFPNPVIDNVTVKSTVRGILVIYDMQGRELLNQNILDEMTTINLGDFSQGIYNYCLFKDGAPVVRDKIMVTK